MPTMIDLAIEVPPEMLDAWTAHPEIVKLGHPALRKVAEPVARIDSSIQALVENMKEVMRNARGLGLAAPQLGISKRILIYQMKEKEGVRVLINPQISSMSGEQTEPREGCLSIPGLHGTVKRAKVLRVRGFDHRNRPVNRKVYELEARVIQHEVDHLNGILFIDLVEPDSLGWASDENDDDDDGEEVSIE